LCEIVKAAFVGFRKGYVSKMAANGGFGRSGAVFERQQWQLRGRDVPILERRPQECSSGKLFIC